jgi:hypothetical protein
MNGGFYKSIIDDEAFSKAENTTAKIVEPKSFLEIIILTIPTSVEAHKMHLQNKVTPKSRK